MELRKLDHCVYLCNYHIVLTTKYRRKIFNDGLFEYVKRKMLEISEYHPLIYYHEINHDKDHIHMLASIAPTISVGSVVRLIKTNTSRKLKEQFPFLKQVYWGTDGIWSSGYFVTTVGINKEIIERYIQQQGKADSGQILLEI